MYVYTVIKYNKIFEIEEQYGYKAVIINIIKCK